MYVQEVHSTPVSKAKRKQEVSGHQTQLLALIIDFSKVGKGRGEMGNDKVAYDLSCPRWKKVS